MSTPTTSAPIAIASSAVRAPMPDETPVMISVLPKSMDKPPSFGGVGRTQQRRRRRILRATETQAVTDRQQLKMQAVFHDAPDAAWQEQCKEKGSSAEPDQIPDPRRPEPGLYQEEDHGPDDRAFKRADPADQHHEDHVSRPFDGKVGLGLEGDRQSHP